MKYLGDRLAPDFGEIFAHRFYELRQKHGKRYTQAELSKRLGCSVGRIVRGHRITMLRPGQFWRLAKEAKFSARDMLIAAGYLED